MLTFAGREYRPSEEELEALADQLEMRGQLGAGIGLYRHLEDATFEPLAARIRDALEPPVSALELQTFEGAAVVLASIDVESSELDRFRADYLAEHEWTSRPLSDLVTRPRRITDCLSLQIGRWFFEDALRAPIGGIDEDTGEDLAPGGVDFAWLAAANETFAEISSRWARLTGSMLADQRVVADHMLEWMRGERAAAKASSESSADEEGARANARAWALREAALWLEACANRARLPWEPPHHQA